MSLRIQLVCLKLLLAVSGFATANARVSVGDTIAPDYDRAVDYCLFHQFAEAETLLRKIVSNPNHPNRDAARNLLLEEVFLDRNHYQAYIDFCDSTSWAGPNLAVAKFLNSQPKPQFRVPAESIQIPLRVKRWPIVKVLIRGKLYRFIVDTGAERTFVSKRLAAELHLSNLYNDAAENSLNQRIPAVFNRIDSLRVGALVVKNLPILQTAMTGFPADGLLGWDVLRQFNFTIDYASQRLILRKPVFHPTVDRKLLGIGRPLMVMQTSTGYPIILFLDTGSNDDLSLTPVGLTKIGTYRTGYRLGGQLGLGGRVRLRREKMVKHVTVRTGRQSFTLRKATVEQSNGLICSVYKDGIVGSKLFKKGRLTVDYSSNYVDYSE